jgi:hypothetical protein
MRFERVTLAHRLLGVVLVMIGGAILTQERGDVVSLGWGAVLALTGLVLALARGGTVLDFEAKKVITYLGLVVPWGQERRPFSSLRVVSVEGRRRDRSLVGGRSEFPVELRGDGPDVRLVEPQVYEKARRLARELAHRMRLGLVDHGVERAPGFVDEPLRDRLLRTGEVPGREKLDASDPYRVVTATREPPPAPAGTRMTAVDGDAETRLTAPRRFRLSLVVASAVGLGLLGAIPWLSDAPTSFAVRWAAPFWLIGFVPLALWMADLVGRFSVVVDARAVRVRTPGVFGRTFSFPLTELDDVHVASAEEPRYANLTSRADYPASWPFIVVRSDRRAVAVAVGASIKELAWLAARIQHAVYRHSLHSTRDRSPV